MTPTFWKLSQGQQFFKFSEMIESIHDGLVYLNGYTEGLGQSSTTQVEDFMNAPVGDYFYLTNSNERIYLLGQFTGPGNVFSKKGPEWFDRPFRLIKPALHGHFYEGQRKWWTPNHNSSFAKVKETELALFEELILAPFFGLKVTNFNLR